MPFYYSMTALNIFDMNYISTTCSTDIHMLPAMKCYFYKWKNHFYEMNGDVGMAENKV